MAQRRVVFWFDGTLAMVFAGLDGYHAEWFDIGSTVSWFFRGDVPVDKENI